MDWYPEMVQHEVHAQQTQVICCVTLMDIVMYVGTYQMCMLVVTQCRLPLYVMQI